MASLRDKSGFRATITLAVTLLLIAMIFNPALNFSPNGLSRYASSTSPSAVWPTTQHDAQRTSFSPYAGSTSNSTDWVFGPTGQIKYSPVIGADGTVYVVDSNFHLYAINPDGSLKWEKTFNEGLFSPSIGPSGTIYVPGTRHLFAFNPDGSSPWIGPYNISTSRNSLIAISQTGIIFEVDTNGTLHAINPFNTVASTIWSLKVSCLPATLAIGPSGSIYCGTASNGTSAALDSVSSTGELLWSFLTKSAVNVPPAIGPDGSIYIVSSGGEIFAVGPVGNQLWTISNVHQEQTSPIIGPNGTLYVAGDKLVAITITGSEIWSEFCYPISSSLCIPFGPIDSMSVDPSGTIYVGTNTSGLIAVNSVGTLKWAFNSLPSGEGIISPQAIGTGGQIFMGTGCLNCNGTGYGHVYAIGRPSGSSPLSVTESGLPTGTNWSFLVAGKNYTTSSQSLFFSLPNGNYNWAAPPSTFYKTTGIRYAASPTSGSIGIPSAAPVSLSFASQYQVNFISSPSAGGNINTGSGLWYSPNSVIKANVTATPGYQFGIWRTDSSSIGITNPSSLDTSIIINGPGTVVGVFDPLVTINAANGGSVIYLDPPFVGNVEAGQSISFYAPSESIVVLTVRPSNGYAFGTWNVMGGAVFDNFSPNVDFRITSPTNLTAEFAVQKTTSSIIVSTIQTSTSTPSSTTSTPQTIIVPKTSTLPTSNVALDIAIAVIIALAVGLGVVFLMGIGFLRRRQI
ncbi:MAG: PQQ-binding-like beta-propeller repeat protein [Thaumarchaeota archaeon]|nr:PQQ-binding-like beta-propeller repeat protein [Nitrososphaerota archaeon]